MGLEGFGDRKPVEGGAPFGTPLILLTAEDSVKPVDDFHDVKLTQEAEDRLAETRASVDTSVGIGGMHGVWVDSGRGLADALDAVTPRRSRLKVGVWVLRAGREAVSAPAIR
jgi:hypothetical protein